MLPESLHSCRLVGKIALSHYRKPTSSLLTHRFAKHRSCAAIDYMTTSTLRVGFRMRHEKAEEERKRTGTMIAIAVQ